MLVENIKDTVDRINLMLSQNNVQKILELNDTYNYLNMTFVDSLYL